MKDWIHSLLLWALRKTRSPYECYWRDRAFAAEKKLAALEQWAIRGNNILDAVKAA